MRSKENKQFWDEFNLMSFEMKETLKMVALSYSGASHEGIKAIYSGLQKENVEGYSKAFNEKTFRLAISNLTSRQYVSQITAGWSSVKYRISSLKLLTEIVFEIFKDKSSYPFYKKYSLSNGIREYYYNDYDRYGIVMTDIICAIFEGKKEDFDKNYSIIKENQTHLSYFKAEKYLAYGFDDILTSELNDIIPDVIKDEIVLPLAQNNILLLKKNNELVEYLERRYNEKPENIDFIYFVLFYYLYVGNWDKIDEILKKINISHIESELTGCLKFLQGDSNKAIEYFELAFEMRKKLTKSVKKHAFENISSFFYVAAHLSLRDIASHNKLREYIKNAKKLMHNPKPILFLEGLMYILENQTTLGQSLMSDIFYTNQSPELKVFYYLCHAWGNVDIYVQSQNIEDLMLTAKNNGYDWVTFLLASVRKKINDKSTIANGIITRFKVNYPYDFVDLIQTYFTKEEDWLQSLKILQQLSSDDNVKKTQSEGRLVWLVNFKSKALMPKEQKINKNGSWSAGKAISIKRLKEGESEYATPQDMKIVSNFDSEYYYSGYTLNFDKACLAMIGHPNLLLEESQGTISVEVIKAEPEILIEAVKNSTNIMVSFSVDARQTGVKVIKETNTRYKVFNITEIHKRIYENLGSGKLSIPEKGREILSKTLGSMVNIVNITSSISNFGIDLPRVDADSQIYALLLPFNNGGLKLELLVKPFTISPPYLKPGKAPETVIGEVNKQKVQTSRNIESEKAKVKKIIKSCEILNINNNSDLEWSFEDPQDCLEVLYQLEEQKENVVIEWPEGQKFKIAHRISNGNMSLSIKKQNDWFDIDAEVRLNENNVIKMAELLEMLDNSKNRFIQLKDGQFLALTEVFRKRLEEIKKFTEKTKDGLRFHNLAALTMDDIVQDFENVKVDTGWKNQIKKIKNAQAINPKVPTTLKTELRNYQIDGFKWLAQLSEWGVGACLADDMGLGKTIQGLALILHRASQGPTLVVAPATVARNWMAEAAKFAPTMNTTLFGGKEREQQMAELKEHDLMVCSYGLLQQDAEKFAKVKWATVILDEAQNIKNMSTKRSKAAMDLQSDFKMITTGTPIENHLGELWNLFRFINAGLLGSLSNFNEKFALPIEKNQEPETQKQLQKLLKPFILRRRKSQVLEELPSKTEITLTVEMSKEESAFYEALRMRAIEKLRESSQENGVHEGERRFQILAEIMKLRQASCNTKLVLKDSDISSSKLELLLETAEELRENGHKALVFSQFVGHLTLIKEAFEKRGFSYKYLDGTTPMKKREESIKEFQNGEADFFLISLKAGGVGLNLTAADYVIHMDPWWNPAVEDQASDRAHRIGQQRPVTIYRLVTKNTIEEKIVGLHRDKRDLADNLLEGTEMSGKISSDELLNLIKQV